MHDVLWNVMNPGMRSSRRQEAGKEETRHVRARGLQS
jgi:hypothetical protein